MRLPTAQRVHEFLDECLVEGFGIVFLREHTHLFAAEHLGHTGVGVGE